jgi:hypothetical protein
MTKVRIEGHEEIISAFRNADTALNRLGRAYLKRWSDYGVKRMQIRILNQGAVDTNELIQNIHYNISQLSNGLQSEIRPSDKADEYAYWVDKGSPPHYVPISKLIGWAERHDANPYAVQAGIAANGTRPRPFWVLSFKDLKDFVYSDADDFADEIVRNL